MDQQGEREARQIALRQQLLLIQSELTSLNGEDAADCCVLCDTITNGSAGKRKLHRTETPVLSSHGSTSQPIAASSSSCAPMPAVLKRPDALCWDDYFMSVAFLSSMRSKDPSTQVGACIVSPDKRIVGIGYNGFPRGCSDDVLPWNKTAESTLDTKYPYVCHAEMNAILNKNSADVKGCAIYVGLFPCNECAKMVIQSGIAEVVYLSDKYHETNSMKASRTMLNMANVTLRQHIPGPSKIEINFDWINE